MRITFFTMDEELDASFYCKACNTDLYHLIDRSMMTYADRSDERSGGCEHRICSVCYAKTFARRTSATCPLCRMVVSQINYSEADADKQWTESEQQIRKRVSAIFSKLRREFPSTPEYDDYLEQKEEKILLMLKSAPEARRKIDMELRQFENEHHSELANSAVLAEEAMKERIREVVRREGTFYELVKLRPWDAKDGLVHPFRVKYMPYFDDVLDAKQQATVNAMMKEGDSVLPKPLAGFFPDRPQDVQGEPGSEEWRKNHELRIKAGGFDAIGCEKKHYAELFQAFNSFF